jgi:restriction system protein
VVLALIIVAISAIARNGWGPIVLAGLAVIVAAFVATWLGARRARKRRQLRDSRDLGALLTLTPAEFERRVALILGANGYRDVRVVGGRGDLAADITCRAPSGESVIVQCKQYAPHRKVSSPDVQTFIGMAFAHHRVDRGLFVTTADYTKDARTLAAKHRLELVDGAGLVTMARLGS